MERQKHRLAVVALCVASAMAYGLLVPSMAMSIELKPRATQVLISKAGPRYEVDEVEKTKLTDSASASPTTTPNYDNPELPPDERTPIGRMSIRRIFLVPVMSGPRPDMESSSNEQQVNDANNNNDNNLIANTNINNSQSGDNIVSLLTRPLWPFLIPVRPQSSQQVQHHHLFGTDESSRSPPPPSGSSRNRQDREREGDPILSSGSNRGDDNDNNNNNSDQPTQTQAAARPIFDPIQMMIDMMHAALSGQLAPPDSPDGQSGGAPPSIFHDLAQEANSVPRPSGSNDADADGDGDNKPPGRGLVRPFKPTTSNNETKEDVVEIDGKKFLRKVEINRHVGQNIVFMTKRLIFTPLNETTTDVEATTTAQPPSSAVGQSESTTTGKPESSLLDKADKPSREVPDDQSPTASTTTPTSEQSPISTSVASATSEDSNPEEPTTLTSSPSASPSSSTPTPAAATGAQSDQDTTTKAINSLVERVSDAIERAAERIVDTAEAKSTNPSSTTTDKPEF